MRKKLIKKGEGGLALFSNQLMGQSSMNFSQPLTDLNDPMIDKLSSPMGNIKLNKLTTPNLVMKGPDTSKIVSGLNSTLFDTGFQNRMTRGQNDYLKEIKSADSAKKWLNFKTNISEFAKSKEGTELINSTIDVGSNLALNATGKEQSTLSSGLSSIGDIGMNPALMSATGGVSGLIGGALKGIGLVNDLTSKKINPVNISSGISGYGGSDLAYKGKQIGGISRLFGADKTEQNRVNKLKNSAILAKSNTDKLLKQNQAAMQGIFNTGIKNQTKLNGGNNYSVLTAKNGATLEDIRNYIKTRNIKKEVLQNSKLDEKIENQEINEIQKFQNGGSLIPSGALHKNKHNLESVNSDLKGEITNKGIPVISYAEKGDILEYEKDGKTPKVLAEGGEIIQHAEIEKDEIILNLSLTKKLVELMKKDTSEAMIEAGKILARELMENTKDNTGLLEKTIGNED